MKFSPEKKNSIKMYILEKIAHGTESLSKYVADELGISTNTVHTYISELIEEKIIEKSKRGMYELVTSSQEHILKRDRGELEHDTYPFDAFLEPMISDLSSNAQHIWNYALSEMVNNVIDHSEAEELYIRIERNYLHTSVLLVDNGVGIFKKIREHFALPNLDEAICELLKGKLTTDTENHSGEGIFFTSKMMDTFFILSDEKIFAATKYDNDSIRDLQREVNGTCVFMSLSNFTNKTAAEIFNLYSSDEGGFAKTLIPLKNIFDKAPISRSQAKRVCNRLDQFSEVTVDFAEIEWMGQGFAHQLFCVYARANPQITITTINMNPDVESMYKHVTGEK